MDKESIYVLIGLAVFVFLLFKFSNTGFGGLIRGSIPVSNVISHWSHFFKFFTQSTLSTDIPSDPKDPVRKNTVDYKPLPKDEKTAGFWDWIKKNVIAPIGIGASAIQN